MSGFGRGNQRSASRLDRAAWLLALIAIVAQLFVPIIALRPAAASADNIFAALFDAGLICHGAGSEQQPEPGRTNGPLPRHAEHALCCVFHGTAGPLVATPLAAAPVRFAFASVAFSPLVRLFIAARPQGAARARDPPINT